MEQLIMTKVKEEYEKIINEYDENKILWVAATGPKIFNSSIDTSIQFSICITPSEEELYTTYPSIQENIFDIRLLIDGIKTHNEDWIEIILSPYKMINPKYEEILNNNLFINKELLFLSNNDTLIKELQKNIKMIIQSSFNIKSQEQELINILTKTELKVLKNIIEDFCGNQEGDIKVSQATEQYKISTAVFRTLFYKLKDYKVAQIDSRGVKGTHIKFNNLSSLNKLID